MARIKFELPKNFLFTTEIDVRIGDINYGGHLGNDSILSLIHEARLRFLREFGYSEVDVDGAGIIMVDSVIIYKSEGFYGDVLVFDVTVTECGKYGCDFTYRLSNKETGKEIARAKTGIVFFDYEKRKVIKMPEKFRELFCNKE